MDAPLRSDQVPSQPPPKPAIKAPDHVPKTGHLAGKNVRFAKDLTPLDNTAGKVAHQSFAEAKPIVYGKAYTDFKHIGPTTKDIVASLQGKPVGTYQPYPSSENLITLFYVGADTHIKQISFLRNASGECLQTYPKPLQDQIFSDFSSALKDPSVASLLKTRLKMDQLVKSPAPVVQAPIERLIDPEGKNSEIFQKYSNPELTGLVQLIRSRVPALNEGIKELAENYKALSTAPDRDVAIIKIAVLHNNLEQLALMISTLLNETAVNNPNLSYDENLMNALGESFSDLNSSVIPDLKPYLTGDQYLYNETSETLSTLLKKEIQKNKEKNAAEISADISIAMSNENEIDPEMLQTSVRLNEVVRGGIQKLKENVLNMPLGTSNNAVFKMPEAYFKTLQTQDKAGAVIEKMIWDMSEILHVQDYFTPTTLTHVPGKYENKVLDTSAAGYVGGGAQIGLSGTNLNHVRPSGAALTPAEINQGFRNIDLNRTSVLEATLISWVFGMYDAHDKNIRVTDDGKIKFFDNTRSLPRSNNLINFGGHLQGTYRCALNATDIAFTDLSAEEKEGLLKKLNEIENRISDLDKYFNSPTVQMQIRKLPPGWFDEINIRAFKTRLNDIREALVDPKNIKLIDVTMDINSFHKFNILLEFIKYYPNVPTQNILPALKAGISRVCQDRIQDLLEICVSEGIDPSELFLESQQPDSLLDLVSLIKNSLDHNRTNPPTADQLKKIQENGQLILREAKRNAEADFKDLTKSRVKAAALNFITTTLQLEKMDIVSDEAKVKALRSNLKRGQSFVEVKGESLVLHYRDQQGARRTHGLDYYSKPGSIIVFYEGGQLPPLRPSEFVDWLDGSDDSHIGTNSAAIIDHINTILPLNLTHDTLTPKLEKDIVKYLAPGKVQLFQHHAEYEPSFTLYYKSPSGELNKFSLKFVEGNPNLVVIDDNIHNFDEFIHTLQKTT